MQFIDQAPAYKKKAISPAEAVRQGRANLTLSPDAGLLAPCFRPELKVANEFDARINKQVRFFELPTAQKLDLLIDGLLPGFFHPDKLPENGRERWYARAIIDGREERILLMDANGIRRVESCPDGDFAIDLETDVVTLMAMLRSLIADHHLKKPAVTNPKIAELKSARGARG